jgi:hypothetical protein
MSAKKPKDLALAEVAYNAFYGETPQVFFDDLAPTYQMRWVRAVRSAVADYRKHKAPPPNGGGSQPVRVKEAAKKPPRAKASRANGSMPAGKLQRWEEADKKDIALFTDKVWGEKSKQEIQARQRLAYRNKQRERYGLETNQSASV